jgi:hypothetical protein
MAGTYDPATHIITWNGITIDGWGKGSFFSMERNSPSFKVESGAGGEATDTRSRDITGKAEATLLQTSLVNDLLSAAWVADEAFGLSFGPMEVKDLTGETVAFSPHARIAKAPPLGLAAEQTERKWEWVCQGVQYFVGGSPI